MTNTPGELCTKVLFLDIDGPMIPRRAYYLPGQTRVASVFDPVAVSLIKRVLDETGAKIVISSSWGRLGKDYVEPALNENGLSWDKYVHFDWITPRQADKDDRNAEIKNWLKAHKEIKKWVSLDDARLKKNNVKVSFEDGVQWSHYLELMSFLADPKTATPPT